MTAAEHLAKAEQLLSDAVTSLPMGGQTVATATVLLAQTHALCALAIELGVPRTAAPEPEQVTQ